MFDIVTDVLRKEGRFFHEGSRILYRYTYDIEDVKEILSEMSDMEDIILTLEYLKMDVKKESEQEEALYEGSVLISRRYDDAEEEILNNMDNSKFEIQVPQYRVVGFAAGNARPGNGIDLKTMDELLERFD